MEKDIALGSVGNLDLSFSAGKASVTIKASESALSGGASASASACVSLDSTALIGLLFAAIEKATPSAAPIEEAVKTVILSAVAAIQ